MYMYVYIGFEEGYTLSRAISDSSTSHDQQTKCFEPSTVADDFSFVTEQVSIKSFV